MILCIPFFSALQITKTTFPEGNCLTTEPPNNDVTVKCHCSGSCNFPYLAVVSHCRLSLP